MRTNHIPAAERLERRLAGFMHKISEFSVPIGGGNPYHKCRHCGISIPALIVPDGKHFDGCPVPGWAKEMVYYQGLLLAAQKITSPEEREDHMADLYSPLSGAGVAHVLKVDLPAVHERRAAVRPRVYRGPMPRLRLTVG